MYVCGYASIQICTYDVDVRMCGMCVCTYYVYEPICVYDEVNIVGLYRSSWSNLEEVLLGRIRRELGSHPPNAKCWGKVRSGSAELDFRLQSEDNNINQT